MYLVGKVKEHFVETKDDSMFKDLQKNSWL